MKVGYLNGMKTSAGALSAYRRWMDTVSENLANSQTTRTADGGAYRRQAVSFEEIQTKQNLTTTALRPSGAEPVRTHGAHQLPAPNPSQESATVSGVNVKIASDTTTPMTQVYDPGHPDAGLDGFVEYPNVNPVTEMVNLIMASRAYEANVAALSAEKRMAEMALSIGNA